MKYINIKYLLLLFLFFWGMSQQLDAQTLENYLEIAAKNNPGVKAAYTEFKATMQKAPQVSSLPDPVLTMSAFGVGPMVKTKDGPRMATFSLMQMFPWFGTLGARKDAATLRAQAKLQSFLDVRNKLYFKVSEQYYQLFALEKRIRFQEENLKILKDYKELALAEVRSGSGALADVLRTKVLMDKTRTALNILKMQKTPVTARFNALLNRDKDARVHIPEKLEIKKPELKPKPDSTFESHPKVLQIENMVAAAKANEEAARKNGLPKLGIGIDYMVIGKPMNMNSMGNGNDAIMPMVSISIPIFRKKYKAAQKEAELMQRSYALKRTKIENTLSTKFSKATFAMEKAREMLELYKNQIKTTKQVLDLLLSGYQNATVDFEEVLKTRQELLRYKLSAAKAKANYYTAMAKMNYLTTETSNHEN